LQKIKPKRKNSIFFSVLDHKFEHILAIIFIAIFDRDCNFKMRIQAACFEILSRSIAEMVVNPFRVILGIICALFL
jgi:hypothetical protein